MKNFQMRNYEILLSVYQIYLLEIDVLPPNHLILLQQTL